MTTAGGPGMNFGDDYVAARLSIDVPQEGVQGVREIRDEVDRFRISMEAAVRSEADHARYLDQMTEAAKRATEAQANLTQSLQTFLTLQGRMGGGSAGVPFGTLQQPFSGMSAGMGPTPGDGPPQAGTGARPPSPSDVAYQVSGAVLPANAAITHPHDYMNMQAPRGNINPTDAVNISPQSINALAERIASRERDAAKQAHLTGDDPPKKTPPPHSAPDTDPYAKFDQRARGALGLAGQVMNEVGPGGSHQGMAGLALGGLNAARKSLEARAAKTQAPKEPTSGEGGDDGGDGSGKGKDPSSEEDPLGGGLGKLAKGLGVGGVLGGGLLGLFGLAQKGGAMVQGMRNMAGVRGGAGGEGFELMMRQRSLAMDPMISGEQSRQVYQALLSEGYANASGKGGDDVKDLMVKAIKDWNLSVPEFVAASRSTAKFTQMSEKSFGDLMSRLREESKTGYTSQPDLQKKVLEQGQQLIAQGVDPNAAFNQANKASQLYKGNPLLEGSQSAVTTDNMAMMERMYGGAKVPAGLRPDAVGQYLSDSGQGVDATQKVFKKYAMMFHGIYRDVGPGMKLDVRHANATAAFHQYITTTGMLAPDDKYQNKQNSDALYDELVWGGQTPQQSGPGQGADAGADTEADHQSAREGAPSGPPVTQQAASGYGRQPLPNLSGTGGYGPGEQNADRQPGGQQAPAQPSAPRTPTGGGPMQQVPVVAQQSTQVGGQVTISLTPEAQRLLTVMGPNPAQLTPTQRAANAGRGGAQVNNPGG